MAEKNEARPVATARASGMPSHAAGLTREIAQTCSHCERDDDYSRFVARLNRQSHIIVLADPLKWSVRRRDVEPANRAHWRGVSFHLSRDMLMAASVSLAGGCDPETPSVFAGIPASFARGCGHV